MNKLINGECLEEMDKLIEEGVKVAAIITDPPYGTTACKWDSIIPLEPMWEQLNRIIIPNGAIVLFGSEPFSSNLRMSNIGMFRYDWIWHKNKSGNVFQYKNSPMKRHETISVFFDGGIAAQCKARYYPELEACDKRVKTVYKPGGDYMQGVNKTEAYKMKHTGYPESVLRFNVDGNRLHPTQKPVALMEYLIKTYTNEGETVLDFTMGSGSTGVACVNLNRNFIGIELDEEYFNIAKARVENMHVQTKMVL